MSPFSDSGVEPCAMSAESQAKPCAGSHDPSLHDTATATKDTGELATERPGSVFKTSLPARQAGQMTAL